MSLCTCKYTCKIIYSNNKKTNQLCGYNYAVVEALIIQ